MDHLVIQPGGPLIDSKSRKCGPLIDPTAHIYIYIYTYIYVHIYICIYKYIAVELLSGPSLGFWRVIIWAKFVF